MDTEFAETLRRMDARFAETLRHMDIGFADLKTEMRKQTAVIIRWVTGTAIALAAAGITVMTFVLNNAVPKAPAGAPGPIVIIIQYSALPPPAPAR